MECGLSTTAHLAWLSACLDAGFSLKQVGDYVGHRTAASTEIYGKVSIEALREVACGDGEAIL